MTISNGEFLFYAILLLLLVIFKAKIVDLVFDIFTIEIKERVIVYLSGVLLLVLLVMGIFFNEGPGILSLSFKDIEPTNNKKPHRYFDIETDGKDYGQE
jgi:hypothetical protein